MKYGDIVYCRRWYELKGNIYKCILCRDELYDPTIDYTFAAKMYLLNHDGYEISVSPKRVCLYNPKIHDR